MTLEEDLKTEWKSSPKPTPSKSMKEIATSPSTILTDIVRKNGFMDLEEAHWKLSKYPAQAAGLLDRGHLAEGMPADIVIYDYENLKLGPSQKAKDLPGDDWRRICKAEGYCYTICNGAITFEGNDNTGATPGKLLRHGSAG